MERVLNFMLRTPCVDLRIQTIADAVGQTHNKTSLTLLRLAELGCVERGGKYKTPKGGSLAQMWRTAPGVIGIPGPVRVKVPLADGRVATRGRKTQHLHDFLHGGVLLAKF